MKLVRSRRLTFGLLVVCAIAALGLSLAERNSAAVVTFSKDVAPIIYAKCATCHHQGEMAPMSLMTFKEVRPWAKSIREKVLSREMPPCYADPNHGQWANDPSLTAQQLETIRAWVDGGSPEGNPKDLHHVIINVREPDQGPLPPAGEIKFGQQAVNPEAARAERRQRGGSGNNHDGMLVGWAPGMSPLTLKPGNAKLIKKGSVLIFQMHYTTTGVAAKDRTSVGLWFSKAPVEKRLITKGIFTDPSKLVIPPGDPNFESRSSQTFNEDVHIHMFMPHMHVRGKDFQYKLVYPDGTSKILLSVPRYDFNWQLTYFAKEPIAVPKGSRIECLAHHDNSANNKFNPDPTITVRWGDQTWEEMMIGWIDYTIDNQDLRQTQTQSASSK
jgi:hypothetical protein